MSKLAAYVYVDGQPYGPNDPLPEAVARRITNPAAWEGGKVPASAPAPASSPARIPAPPRSGRGSGADAWEAFAKASGVEFDADATRDEIIAACEQAGVIEVDGQ
ncbi:hypothetical protein [Micromonospora maritima]|uniref:hypothetical protein n=1 Tax=Micromonospora maritima TaxID=986711 RepID=UPI00157C9720|nr:hypothetical protein [Micromonospora maritima]